MLNKADFDILLQHQGILVIDGALATEMESRGYDLNHALWSAKVLKHNPKAIKQIHYDYFLAGADVVITASYQASVQGLREHFGMTECEAIDLIHSSVDLAQQAREDAYRTGESFHSRKLLIAGSVGPYGAYLADGSEYHGDYTRTIEQFQGFHRPRLRALIKAGVDLLAIETMPNFLEIEALLLLLRKEFPNTIAWLSMTLKDAGHLSDGTPLAQIVKLAKEHESRIVALGFNCVPNGMITRALKHLVSSMERAPPNLPLICYPNSGETWNAEKKAWEGSGPSPCDVSNEVRVWKAVGAQMIGGCCRTGPAYIKTLSRVLRNN